ncbi:DICT sensory domain-containing protein [Halosimplex salinum]|uniref:DICT sensory domain-containing protein n=1 Tax=Halosimplex salinum TaxID=1710538 RepID=UPI000F4A3CE4|nr:DICT sensory domain-containing protein [Halosimplex salinum]
MAGSLGAVIDDLASERRELVAVNPPDDDEPLDEVLDYFERFDVSGMTRISDSALPDGTLLVTDGDRCLGAADLSDLHAYLFDPGVSPGGTPEAPADWPATETDAGETGADEAGANGTGGGWSADEPAANADDPRRLTDATLTGVQQFLARLDNRVYTVSGEPATPMVGVSRHIEQRALAARGATVHAGFQSLSRLRDQRQTLDTYRTLAERGTEVNLYGVHDWDPPRIDGVSVYADEEGAVSDYWFVVVDSDEYGGGALVAREDEPDVYTGFWTFRPSLVADVVDVVEGAVQPELTRVDG